MAIRHQNTEQDFAQHGKTGKIQQWLEAMRKKAEEAFFDQKMPDKIHSMNLDMVNGMIGDGKQAKNERDSSNAQRMPQGVKIISEKSPDALARQGIIITSLAEYLEKNPGMAQGRLYSQSFTENKFAAMNSAFWNRGIAVHLQKNARSDDPIHISYELTEKLNFDRALIVAEPGSKAIIMESVHASPNSAVGNDEKILRSHEIEVFAEDSSEIFYGKIQNMPDNVYDISIKKGKISSNAKIDWMDCTFGGRTTVSECFTDLAGQGAKTNNWGLFYGNKSQKFGIFLRNQHSAQDTVSDMLTKGILDDKANSIYEGTVKIREGARGSNGYQKQDVLILSPKAAADAQPNLEIDNNDVRCTHGVTIGQLDKEKMFYLMSRGLNGQQAKRKMVEGFLEAMLSRLTVQRLKDQTSQIIAEIMENMPTDNTKPNGGAA